MKLSLRTRIEIYLRDRGDGTYRQQLRAFEEVESPIKPLDLPAVKPLKAMKDYRRMFSLLRGGKVG